MFAPIGNAANSVHLGRCVSQEKWPEAARPSVDHLPVGQQFNALDNLHVRDAKAGSIASSVEHLWLHCLVDDIAHHFAIVHLLSLPFGHYVRGNMEELLQTIRVGGELCVYLHILIHCPPNIATK